MLMLGNETEAFPPSFGVLVEEGSLGETALAETLEVFRGLIVVRTVSVEEAESSDEEFDRDSVALL